MFLISPAWWLSKLSGIALQAMAVVAVVVLVVGGLAWLRHDAVQQERRSAAVKMEKARTAHLLALRRRERDATAVGARAEKDLLTELDALQTLYDGALKDLASRPPSCSSPLGRVVCYPKAVARELNR